MNEIKINKCTQCGNGNHTLIYRERDGYVLICNSCSHENKHIPIESLKSLNSTRDGHVIKLPDYEKEAIDQAADFLIETLEIYLTGRCENMKQPCIPYRIPLMHIVHSMIRSGKWIIKVERNNK